MYIMPSMGLSICCYLVVHLASCDIKHYFIIFCFFFVIAQFLFEFLDPPSPIKACQSSVFAINSNVSRGSQISYVAYINIRVSYCLCVWDCIWMNEL